jgi:ferredoxin
MLGPGLSRTYWMPMNVEIIRSQCCGSGFCVDLAPDVFALDSKQRAIVLDPEAASREVLLEAAEACPCEAIVVDEDALEAPLPRVAREAPREELELPAELDLPGAEPLDFPGAAE